LLEEWIAMTAEDAQFFGCETEIAHARRIVAEGTSADRQLAIYDSAIAGGAAAREALTLVVDHLSAETLSGCGGTAEAPRVAASAPGRAPAEVAERR
jgi:carboxylate-amine ligase